MGNKKRIAIALGSNLGDRLGQIHKAVDFLKADLLENATLSSVIETEPCGIREQPKFLNAVIVGGCEWKPPTILAYLKSLEKDLGRKSREKNGPREMDLDLLAVEDLIFESEGLTVPHIGISQRDFVLIPFAEVWPDWEHPVFKRTVRQMLDSIR